MSRRASRRRRRENASTSSPRNRTLPEVGSISRSRHRPVVVLPLPDSPTRPNVSPASISKLTSSTAATDVPRRSRPPPRMKCFTRCDTSTSGIVAVSFTTALYWERPLAWDPARAGLSVPAVAPPGRFSAIHRAGNTARHVRRRRCTPAAAPRRMARSDPDNGDEMHSREERRRAPGPIRLWREAGRRAPRRASTPSSPRVYGCCGERRTARTGPCSTIRPAYITATRSAVSAMTPRSWVMSSNDKLKIALHLPEEVENLRLNRDVQCGRRLVGDDERRLAGDRHGDEHPLAHAARQLVRVVSRAGGRVRNL